MKVAVHLNLTAFKRLADHLFDGVWLREQLGRRVLVLPVEIVAGQAAAVVANDDAVRVQHRDHLEDIARPEHLGCRCVTYQELQ